MPAVVASNTNRLYADVYLDPLHPIKLNCEINLGREFDLSEILCEILFLTQGSAHTSDKIKIKILTP